MSAPRPAARGLGESGKAGGRGLLVPARRAVDAATGHGRGLVGGRLWTRRGRIPTPPAKRPLSGKESQRGRTPAARAKTVLAAAARVTVVADRESHTYAVWSSVPDAGFPGLGRVSTDRSLAGGGRLFTLARPFPVARSRWWAPPALRSASAPTEPPGRRR